MTSINTLLAPILTPAITYLLLRTTVNVDVSAMFISILQIILVPIILGFIMNHFFHTLTQKLVVVLPMVSTIAICMIIATVVSHNVSKIYTSGNGDCTWSNLLCLAQYFRSNFSRII